MKLLRAAESAKRLGVSPTAVRALADRGLLRSVRDWSNHRRFLESDVEKFREQLLAGNVGAAKK